MKIHCTFILLLVSLNVSAQTEFIRGVDVSSLKVIEESSGEFFQDRQPVDALQLFKENGANYVRLRLWHSPEEGNYNLDYTLDLAQRVRDNGMKLLLDIFYSDTWADPGKQFKPAVWEELTLEELSDSVFNYTSAVISAFKQRDLLPEMIQIGNEINCGMLWPEGNICEDDSKWENFSQLLISAHSGMQSVLSEDDSVKIILQSASGGDVSGTRWFYDNLIERNVEFDIIGLSYYPWWHGTLKELEANLNDAAIRYGKEIIVVETAYPWTLDWNDNTHNLVGLESQLHEGYPATPEGQKQFLLDEIEIIKNTPNGLGAGWFYWEPAYITSDAGSPWENLAMFDFEGEVLPAIEVFNSIPASVENKTNTEFFIELRRNYPNPFNEQTRFKYAITGSNNKDKERFVRVAVYNSVGQKVVTLLETSKTPGIYDIQFNSRNLPNGIYFYQLQVDNLIQTRKMILLK